MYKPLAFSPFTIITSPVAAGDMTIYVEELSVFLPAPNIATIGYTGANPETILYSEKSAESGPGYIVVERAKEGTAQAWAAGTKIARVFTALDLETIQINIETLAAKASHVHIQSVPAAEWTVKHNLGYFPSCAIVDSAGTLVQAEVRYLDENTVKAIFAGAFSGKCYFS